MSKVLERYKFGVSEHRNDIKATKLNEITNILSIDREEKEGYN